MSHEDRRPPAPRTPSHVHAHTHTHRVSSLLMQMLGMVINQQEKKGGGGREKRKRKEEGERGARHSKEPLQYKLEHSGLSKGLVGGSHPHCLIAPDQPLSWEYSVREGDGILVFTPN